MQGTIEIGSFEAKTKLPELLRGVRQGKRYTITHRGEPIADLVPTIISDEVAAGVAHMQRLMDSYSPIHGADTKALVEEGRD